MKRLGVQTYKDPEVRGKALERLEADKRVNVPNAAAILGLHPYTIRIYVTQGYLRPVMIGKRPWFTSAEIDRFLSEGKPSATQIDDGDRDGLPANSLYDGNDTSNQEG